MTELTPEKRAELRRQAETYRDAVRAASLPASDYHGLAAIEAACRLRHDVAQQYQLSSTPEVVLSLLDALDAAEAKAERLQTCWHCKVSLMPDDFAPRCEGCPDECDADDCQQEGCIEQLAKHPGLVPRGDLR